MAYQSVEGWSSKGASASDGAKYSGYSGSGTYGTSHVKVGARDPTRNQEMVGAQVRAHSQEMVELLATWGVHRWWHLNVSDGSRRDKTILHMLYILNGLLYIVMEGLEVVDFLLDMFFFEKVKALGSFDIPWLALVPWLTLVGGDSEELDRMELELEDEIFENPSKVLESESGFDIVDDESNRNSSVEVTNDTDTFVEL
ncbi:hypothetical protein Tco_0551238 [Tanacetum coccineum]